MEEFHVDKFTAVDCHGAAKPHHVDEGITCSLFCPGRSAWEEVTAYHLNQYAGHKSQVKNNAEKAERMVKVMDELIQPFFKIAHG